MSEEDTPSSSSSGEGPPAAAGVVVTLKRCRKDLDTIKEGFLKYQRSKLTGSAKTRPIKSNASTQGAPETDNKLFDCVMQVALVNSESPASSSPRPPAAGPTAPQWESVVKEMYPRDFQVQYGGVARLCFPDLDRWPLSRHGGRPCRRDNSAVCHNETYVLILTDSEGRRKYAYCRRVVPEGMDVPLPLAYCIIAANRNYKLYDMVLESLGNNHGCSTLEAEILFSLYYCQNYPASKGQAIVTYRGTSIQEDLDDDDDDDVSYPRQQHLSSFWSSSSSSAFDPVHMVIMYPETDGEFHRFPLIPSPSSSTIGKNLPDSSSSSSAPFSSSDHRYFRLLTLLGAHALCQAYLTLLLDGKVVIYDDGSDPASSTVMQVANTVAALDALLSPFRWNHTIVTLVPNDMVDNLVEAPTPFLIGVLGSSGGNRINPDDDPNPSAFNWHLMDEGVVVDIRSRSEKVKLFRSTFNPLEIFPVNLTSNLLADLMKLEDSDPNGLSENQKDRKVFQRFQTFNDSVLLETIREPKLAEFQDFRRFVQTFTGASTYRDLIRRTRIFPDK